MKRKMSLRLVVLLLVSALASSVFAQAQADRQQEEMRKKMEKAVPQNPLERLQEERQQTVRKTMLIDKQVITLLQAGRQSDDFFNAIVGEAGKVAYIQIPPTSLNGPTAFRNATLRIEMMDGSVQEIPLFKVKEVAIEQHGNIR